MELKVKEMLKQKHLTIRKAAKQCEIPVSTLADICAGAIPRLDTMERLAKGLGCRINDLYDSPYK